MRILLYNPDNGVTRNFMPHLWMFLLQALTPAGHEVLLVDGNAQPMDETQIAQFVRDQNIGLVGIGAMTRMHVGDRFNVFLARLCFRGIYFPMLRKSSWLRVIIENRRTILRLFKEGVFRWMRPRNSASQDLEWQSGK